MTSTAVERVPVLIVGGGPAGLSAAIALARQGVRVLLVEQRAGITDHPKARAINVRTMELVRQWGLEQALDGYALPAEYWRFIWCTTLAGREIARIDNDHDEGADRSPTRHRIVSQDAVESVLLAAARALRSVTLRFSTRCRGVRQDGRGVLAEVEDLTSGRKETIAARFLIAADGATSDVRRGLGIAMRGPASISQQASIYFRADLPRYSTQDPADVYYCTEGIWIGVVDGKRRWLGIMGRDGGIRRRDFTPEFCAEHIRRSVGVENLPVEVINVSFWNMGAQVAERFRQRNVFLTGDAAHRMSPTGGFGLNTGVQDSHNLAWKLAAVLSGRAGEKLLDTYESERQPVAASNAEWSAENARRIWAISAAVDAGHEDRVQRRAEEQKKHICSEGRALGFRYESAAVVPDGVPAPAFSSRVYRPTACPGCRAPHRWLEKGGRRLSTLDLFERSFVLLSDGAGNGWRSASARLAPALRPFLQTVAIGEGGDLRDPGAGWRGLYGLEPGGAVLVRPDGHVAWRSARRPADPAAALAEVLAAVVGREAAGPEAPGDRARGR